MSSSDSLKLLGKIALKKGFLSKENLKVALRLQNNDTPEKLGHILVNRGFISEEQLKELLEIHEKKWGYLEDISFGNLLIENEIVTASDIEKTLHETKRTGKRLGEALEEKRLITKDEICSILKSQERLSQSHGFIEKAHVQCPNCSATFKIKDPEKPRDVRCGKCKFIFQVGLIVVSVEETAYVPPLKKSEENETTDTSDTLEVRPSKLIEETLITDRQCTLQSFLRRHSIVPDAQLLQSTKVDIDDVSSTRYVYGREVGRGGMGAIIATQDLDTRRNLVTKILHKNTSKKAVLRFIEEAQITAQLEHPNIVPVYDIGVNKEGNVYYTMKHVKGQSLQTLIEMTTVEESNSAIQLDQSRIIEIMIDVCNAVSFAHSKKVIHRDLKPENIMIGEYGEVILMDFGLAKILNRQNGEVENLEDQVTSDRSELDEMKTIQGAIAGTPRFMAPEQAKGDIQDQDEQTDIYALGAILFNCIAHDVPVPGKNVQKLLKNIVAGVRNDLPVDTPAELGAIIKKAMAVKKSDRYLKVSELSSDLHLFLKGYSISAKEDHFGEIIVKLVKRNLQVFITSVIALLVLIAGGTFAVMSIVQEKEEAVNNLNKYLIAQKTADLEKAGKERLLNEKVKQWKLYYEESFKDLVTHELGEESLDYGFGNWGVYLGRKGLESASLKELEKISTHKVWHADKKIFFSSNNDGYLYLNRDLYGNIRLDATVEFISGTSPEVTVFIAGSREQQERDGYSFAIGSWVKIQKKGQTLFEIELSEPLEANKKRNIRFEKNNNFLRAYIDDMERPIFQWEDSEPLYGEKNSLCGFYAWNSTIAFEKFSITKQTWAKQNTPIDFVERLRKKGYDELAIEEYREIIFSTDDDVEKAQALFEMGTSYKKIGKVQEASFIFNLFVNRENSEKYNFVIPYEQVDDLVKKSYVFLLLMVMDKELKDLDPTLVKWPKQLEERFKDVVINCKGHSSLEIVFNYIMTKKVTGKSEMQIHLRTFNLLKSLFEYMNESSLDTCKKSFSDFLFVISIKYFSTGGRDLAEKFLTEAISVKPNDERFYFQRGSLRINYYSDPKKREEGVQDALLSIKINPTLTYAYSNIAYYYWSVGQIDKAIDLLTQGLDKVSYPLTLYKTLVQISLEVGNNDLYESSIKKMNEIAPNNPTTNYLVGFNLLRKNELALLENHLESNNGLHFDAGDYYYLLGLLRMAQNKDEEARAMLLKGVTSKSSNNIKRLLANVCFKLERYSETIEWLNKIKIKSPLSKDEEILFEKAKEKLSQKTIK